MIHLYGDHRGGVLESLGRYVDALKCFDKALELEPEEGLNWHSKGSLLDKMWKKDEAKHYFERAIKCYDAKLAEDPEDKYAWGNRASALEEITKYDSALKSVDKALKIDPDYDWALNLKGYILWRMKNYSESIKYLDKAIDLESEEDYYYDKARVFCALKQYENALELFNKALSLNPRHYKSLYAKGVIMEEMGKPGEALDYYKKTLDVNPYNKTARNAKKVLEVSL